MIAKLLQLLGVIAEQSLVDARVNGRVIGTIEGPAEHCLLVRVAERHTLGVLREDAGVDLRTREALLEQGEPLGAARRLVGATRVVDLQIVALLERPKLCRVVLIVGVLCLEVDS